MVLGAEKKRFRLSLPAGWTGRLFSRFARRQQTQPRLELIERISLAPRQSLALVEAEGRKFLVACSADSTPAFYPIGAGRAQAGTTRMARVSW